ncbi:outer membrane beta-barrel protein [Pleomorphovibrio marinus]|uniref:outer membrane beta-barrel protein n=1 Tax=Pleomorphovibrio marinus TaxID=2164132 RepID=UPI000E0C2B79|nr:outer membrane beta-barrel protein [Pleomorphovibrio marinus]
MKKYVIAIFMLALIQQVFGAEIKLPEEHYLGDSIIVEFGNSGQMVFIVDNPEDFERLKKLDINQIIQELDVPQPEKEGHQTVVEVKYKDGNKEIFRIYEDGPETEVSIGRYKLKVDESGSRTTVNVETAPKQRKDPAFRTYFSADLGINNYFQNGNIPGPGAPYAVKGWGSWNVNLNYMASQRISNGLFWDFGLGVHWYNFKFENRSIQALPSEGGVDFINRTDVNGFKSKVSASYLTTLTMLKLDFGKLNDSGRNGLRVGIGPYAGYRLGGRSKLVYRHLEGSGRRKEHEPAGSYLNNFRYGLRGEVGFRSITLFTTYDLNPLFHSEVDPSLNAFSFGITF